MERSVTLVGPMPKPIGGISSYCSRCVNGFLSVFYTEILDIYPSDDKVLVNNEVKHHLSRSPYFLMRLFWLWRKVSFSRSKIIHFNFSSTAFLLFILFCLKNERRWVLMLHNGSLECCGHIRSFLVKLAINKFDRILVLSDKQRQFYLDYTSELNLMSLDSYLPPTVEVGKSGVNFQSFFDRYGKVIVGSGYALEFYRLDYIVDYAKSHSDIGVVVVTYGDSSTSVVSMLKHADECLDNFLLLETMPENQFLYLLSKASLYVRPNDVDSFGLACADSILLNTPVVASDVCQRFDGSCLFKAGDYEAFVETVDTQLNRATKKNNLVLESIIKIKLEQYVQAYKL